MCSIASRRLIELCISRRSNFFHTSCLLVRSCGSCSKRVSISSPTDSVKGSFTRVRLLLFTLLLCCCRISSSSHYCSTNDKFALSDIEDIRRQWFFLLTFQIALFRTALRTDKFVFATWRWGR
jgi:hypothetical protein